MSGPRSRGSPPRIGQVRLRGTPCEGAGRPIRVIRRLPPVVHFAVESSTTYGQVRVVPNSPMAEESEADYVEDQPSHYDPFDLCACMWDRRGAL
jgi:hypothetical protein